jgi:hypothetical protein
VVNDTPCRISPGKGTGTDYTGRWVGPNANLFHLKANDYSEHSATTLIDLKRRNNYRNHDTNLTTKNFGDSKFRPSSTKKTLISYPGFS